MTKITFKTVHKAVFTVDAEPTDTVLDLKKKIAESQGYAVETQKIIFSGKILADDKTVQSVNIKEKDFCVVMVTKPKAAAAPAPPAASAPSTSSAPAAPAQEVPSTPAQAATTPVAPNAPAPASSASSEDAPMADATPAPAAAAAAPSGGDTSFLMGSHLENTINEIVGMGFPVDQVRKAMRAAFNNADRAVEYLMTGIPASANQEAPPPSPQQRQPPASRPAVPATPGTPSPATSAPSSQAAPLAQTPAHPPAAGVPRNLFEAAAAQAQAARQPATAPAAGGATAPASGGNANQAAELAALRNNPAFAQIRTLVQQNPALLNTFLAQLSRTNPELLALIDRHQEEFMNFIQEGTEGEDLDDEALMGQIAAGLGGGEGEGGAPGSQYVQVTEEERAAIDRLVAMGFERNLVIQAFLACDRNEELTANYLVEHGWQDDD